MLLGEADQLVLCLNKSYSGRQQVWLGKQKMSEALN